MKGALAHDQLLKWDSIRSLGYF